VAQLCQHQEELKQLNVAVVLISFGPQEIGKDWLEEICPSFQLLIDPERNIYRAYKLKRSWLSSWNLKTVVYYARALFGGREWRGIIGDSAQLGGDFIINQDGSFLLEYRSEEATDRPAVSRLLQLLENRRNE
jgi:hypothetical protein